MKPTNYFFKALLFVTIGISFTATASAQVLDDIQNRFKTYNETTYQEKLFVHTDKSFYLTGEVIWFKLYNISQAENKLVDASKIAYVEVLGKDNSPILQGKIELSAGTGNGSFYIPVSAATGNYKIRAYTNWMKNFGADKYFEKNITIVNSLKEITMQAKEVADADYDVQFFPEGGSLVNGMAGKVAYRVVGSNGKGVDFTGAIVNRTNDTIARFKPYKFGIGTFMFTPDGNNLYRAILKVNGKIITKPLPAIATTGYAIQLSDVGTQIKVDVRASANSAGAVYLVAHNRQTLNLALTANLSNGQSTFLIDKNKLSEGISHLTVFNGDKQPVSERLYMVRPTQKLTINAATDKPEYTSRKNVTVNIQANNAGKPEASDLSLAVYRLDSLETATPESIHTYIWLTSELKGNIESADYYLNNTDNEAMDNLLLTHGWSMYNWNDFMQANAPAFKYLPEFDGHIITGKITDPATTAGVKDKQVLVSVPGKRVQLYNSKTNADGNFLINTKNLVGPNELVVQPRLEQDTLLKAQVFNPFSEKYSSTRIPDVSISKNLYSALNVHSLGMQVQNIYTGDKLKQQYLSLTDTTSTFNGAQKQYLLDNYVRFTTMEEVLREVTREVLVVKNKDQFRFRVTNVDYFMDKQPFLIFDGVPIYNPNTVIAADPLKVRMVEVIPHQYLRGDAVEYGVISFTTYKGDLGGVEINPKALVMDYEGLQLSRDFFSPVYETPKQISSTLPDFRTTLYWAPYAGTDATGKRTVNFYTSDQAGKYIGVLQGISATGKSGIQTFNFEVKGSVAP
jgi:hypothetical protein